MPIYEYTCAQCHSDFELLVRSTTVPECPNCHSTALDKKLSVFATAGAGAQAGAMAEAMAAAGPCGTCGHPDGPGSCALH